MAVCQCHGRYHNITGRQRARCCPIRDLPGESSHFDKNKQIIVGCRIGEHDVRPIFY